MSSIMERDKLDQMAEELAKGVTSEKDLSASFSELMKKTLEKALEAEMDVHLGDGKHEPSGRKKLKTESCEFDLETPRDRESSFAPQIVQKRQRVSPSWTTRYFCSIRRDNPHGISPNHCRNCMGWKYSIP